MDYLSSLDNMWFIAEIILWFSEEDINAIIGQQSSSKLQ